MTSSCVSDFNNCEDDFLKVNKEQKVECSGKNDLHRVVIYSSNTS